MGIHQTVGHLEFATRGLLIGAAASYSSGAARGRARYEAQVAAVNAARAQAIRNRTARRIAAHEAGRDVEVRRILASL